MAAAMERANIGYDEARMEGKGPVVGAVDAVKAAAGKGGVAPATGVDYPSGLENRGTEYGVECWAARRRSSRACRTAR
jgi:hypothetical protein